MEAARGVLFEIANVRGTQARGREQRSNTVLTLSRWIKYKLITIAMTPPFTPPERDSHS